MWAGKWVESWASDVGNIKVNQLTARAVATLEKPGRHTDGLGLMLVIDASGGRRWILRITINGRRRDLGLGSAREVSLAEARRRRDEIRAVVRDGRDPVSERNAGRDKPTFRAFSVDFHEAIGSEFKTVKHRKQWLRMLETHAFPEIGALRIDQIDAPAVKRMLEPIWTTKQETARRVKQRVARIMGAAIADGLHPGPNPADDATKGLAARRSPVKHHASMPYREVPAFLSRLRSSGMDQSSLSAFAFLILTAKRTSEVLGARWEEISLDRALWVVPGERMKMGAAHEEPLVDAQLELLASVRPLSGGVGLVFPGGRRDRPWSNMVFSKAMRRLGVHGTPHGFRSSFRDWAEETTDFSYAVKEAALAHAVSSRTEAAYRRTSLLSERRELMTAWVKFLDAP